MFQIERDKSDTFTTLYETVVKEGFEPPLSEPNSDVLPLRYKTIQMIDCEYDAEFKTITFCLQN